MAHAESLDIQYVIFDDQFWSAHSARGQWHPYKAPTPANEMLRHLDHVHVDVIGGISEASEYLWQLLDEFLVLQVVE